MQAHFLYIMRYPKEWKEKIVLSLIIVFVQGTVLQGQEVLTGSLWKKQGLSTLLFWSSQIERNDAAFFPTYLKRNGDRYGDSIYYPGMQARHVFSYATGYLLSGRSRYLQQAQSTADAIVEKGWDKEYGGWYDAVDKQGRPRQSTKDLFMQTYAITGLSLLYITTLNVSLGYYIDRSINLLEKQALDSSAGGYYRTLYRDLSVKNRTKEFTPNIAPLSGYLMYLYPVLRKEEYIRQVQRQLRLAHRYLRDSHKKWVRESFTADWEPLPKKNRRVNVGHNIEVVWLLLRAYVLTKKTTYKKRALALYQKLKRHAFNARQGVWYNKLRLGTSKVIDSTSSWWVQAYGNMCQLYLYRVTDKAKYLEQFTKGARFWNKYFVDDRYGGTYLKVNTKGELIKDDKAVRSKTSYHAMEHAFLNYLYVTLWVEEASVQLHYRIRVYIIIF